MRHGAAASLLATLLVVGDGASWAKRSPPAEVAARRSLWTRDLERSVASFRAALAADPHDADAATNLGRALSRLGRRDEAIEAWRTAIRLAPSRWVPYAGFADAWSRHDRRWQRSGDVLEVLEAGLSRVPTDGTAAGLVIATANFERSIGRTGAARRRLATLERLPLPPEDRKRIIDLQEALRTEEQARGLLDWPEPTLPPGAEAALAEAEAKLSRGAIRDAAALAARLCREQPGWRAPVWLRARALERLERYDEAERQLTVLLQLAPSHARGWRHLGRLLAEHGGSLDAERADEALARALELEPGWWDLWLLRARVAVRRGRGDEARRMIAAYLRSAGLSECGRLADRTVDPSVAAVSRQPRCVEAEAQIAPLRSAIGVEEAEDPRRPPPRPLPPPTPRARDLYREAQAWLAVDDPVGLAPMLLGQALADSPAFIEAAVSAYAAGGEIPDATVQALWGDGDALLELARRVRPLIPARRPPPAPVDAAVAPAAGEPGQEDAPTRTMAPPAVPPRAPRVAEWLDRAVALGNVEARFERGMLRLDRGERESGLDDLRRYVASGPRLARLDEARLRLAMVTPMHDVVVPARGATFEDPREPRALLPAEPGAETVRRCDGSSSTDELSRLGAQREWAGDLSGAASCYLEQLRRAQPPVALAASHPDAPAGRLPPAAPLAEPLRRLAGIGARAPLPLVASLEPQLALAAGAGVPVAEWALARLLLERGETDAAIDHLDAYLAAADAEDPDREPARATRARVGSELVHHRRRRTLELAGAAAAGLALLLLALWMALRGRSLARALQRKPALFPEVARVVNELRHDVLKHKTSALGLLAAGQVGGAEVARVLCEPEGASDVVARAYQQLRTACRARGVTLRPLHREPLFGPLHRDLRKAEQLVRRTQLTGAMQLELEVLDTRLRDEHGQRLASLLRLGPRTRVDAERMAEWLRAAEAELSLRGVPWTSPVLHFARLDLDFPVEPEALAAVFSNLLRNAQLAVAGQGAIAVRVDEERDHTGRGLRVLRVGDTATEKVTLSDIEARESGRGLAIVRDLVHEWRGHLAIRPEEAPWTKSIAACFPAAP